MDQEYYKRVLLDMKQDMSKRISSIDKDIRHEGMSADWSEQASERENDEVLESLGNTSEQVLSMVKYALMRLEDGTYAYCDECGEAIPEARLKSIPYTAHCVNCAEKIET